MRQVKALYKYIMEFIRAKLSLHEERRLSSFRLPVRRYCKIMSTILFLIEICGICERWIFIDKCG